MERNEKVDDPKRKLVENFQLNYIFELYNKLIKFWSWIISRFTNLSLCTKTVICLPLRHGNPQIHVI